MSRIFGVLHIRSYKAPGRPWVLLQQAEPKWIRRGHYRYEEEAFEAAKRWMRPGDSVHRIIDDEGLTG